MCPKSEIVVSQNFSKDGFIARSNKKKKVLTYWMLVLHLNEGPLAISLGEHWTSEPWVSVFAIERMNSWISIEGFAKLRVTLKRAWTASQRDKGWSLFSRTSVLKLILNELMLKRGKDFWPRNQMKSVWYKTTVFHLFWIQTGWLNKYVNSFINQLYHSMSLSCSQSMHITIYWNIRGFDSLTHQDTLTLSH